MDVLDLVGTFVFALSGGVAAIRRQLDLFGVVLVGLAAGTAGGVVRDVLLGQTPPLAVRDWRYLAAAALGSVVVMAGPRAPGRAGAAVVVLDAAGLGLFTVAGTLNALALSVAPVGAVVVGMITGIGGGIARDLLVGEVPLVLRRDVYAIAAIAGALVVVAGRALALPIDLVAPAAAALCFIVRVVSWRYGWQLPRPLARG